MNPYHIRASYIVTAPTFEALQRRVQNETFPELISRNATFTGVEVVDGSNDEDKKANRKLLKMLGIGAVLAIGMIFSAQSIFKVIATTSLHDKYSASMTGNTQNFLNVEGGYSVCYDPTVFSLDKSNSTSTVKAWTASDGSKLTIGPGKSALGTPVSNEMTQRKYEIVAQGYEIPTLYWSDKGYVIIATSPKGIHFEKEIVFASGATDVLKLTMPANKDNVGGRIRSAEVMGGCFMLAGEI